MLKLLRASLLILCCVASSAAAAQDRPAGVPTEMTPEMEATIRAGVELHDTGKFDEAIAKYREVLAKSPGNVVALFELAYSQLSKKDYDGTIATATTGAGYDSPLLPMFYDVMASAYDSKGDPQQAIATYRRGIAVAPAASQLYYNLAVTYQESLKDPDQARLALEQAAALSPLHPGVQLLLGQVFHSGGYSIPAWLALSTFLVIEPGGPQGLQGYGLWRALLKGSLDPVPEAGAAPPDTAARAMRTTAPARTEEGDFSATERQFTASYQALLEKIDNGIPEIAALVAQVDAVLGTLQGSPAGPGATSFVNRHYVPFFIELRRNNHVEPFVYWAAQRAPVPGVREWITANETRVRAYLDWASAYSWPKP